MSRPHLLLLALLLGLFLPTAVHAEEETVAKEDFSVRARTFPAPSAEGAFAFRGRVRLDGLELGTLALAAKAGAEGEQSFWEIEDRLELLGGDYLRAAGARLDRTLRPLRGTQVEREPGGVPTQVRWQATEKGWHIERVEGEGPDARTSARDATFDGPATIGMSAFALLTRHVLPETGSFEVALFRPGKTGDEPLFQATPWEVGKDGTWAGKAAWCGRGTKSDGDSLELYFEPETEALVGVRLRTADGKVLEIGAEDESTEARPSPFEGPAKTPEAAAMQAGLAMSTADLELLERVVHWPSVHAAMAAAHEAETAGQADAEPFPGLDAFKTQLLAVFRERLQERPRPMIEAALVAAQGELKTKRREDGLVTVTFPEIFRSLQLVVGEFDGVWYLARLPQ